MVEPKCDDSLLVQRPGETYCDFLARRVAELFVDFLEPREVPQPPGGVIAAPAAQGGDRG